MKWFKHDANASIDAKLKRVRLKYGMEGYGLYWYCLELVAQTVEIHNLTFELEHDAELISMDTGIHQERVQEMMADLVKWGLFENNHGVITCLKMAKRTDEYTNKLLRTNSGQTPDKIPPNRTEQNRIEQNRNIHTNVCMSPEGDLPKNNKISCPHNDIVDAYHKILYMCPSVRVWNEARKAHLRARWNEEKKRQSVDWWKEFFDYICKSDFLTGKTDGRDGQPPFVADLAWIIKPSNFCKIIEGKYHR